MKILLLAIVAVWSFLGASLFADGDSVGTPTTILTAFIAITMSLGGLAVWVVKRLFTEIEECRKETEKVRQAWGGQFADERKAMTEALTLFRKEGELFREHQARDREQYGLLANAEREFLHSEHLRLCERIESLTKVLKEHKCGS